MRLPAVILLALWSSGLFAQHNDFGQWYAFKVNTKLSKKLQGSVELANRFLGPGSQLDNSFIEFGLKRKINDFLRAEAEYRFAGRPDGDDGLVLNQRWAFGFRLKGEIGNVDLAVRTRYQFRPEGWMEGESLDLNSTWRNRVRAEVKVIKRTWLTSDLELFAQPGDDRLELSRWRTRLRVVRKLDKRLYASVGGLYQRELNTRDPNGEWVLQVSVQWEWKRKKKKGA